MNQINIAPPPRGPHRASIDDASIGAAIAAWSNDRKIFTNKDVSCQETGCGNHSSVDDISNNCETDAPPLRHLYLYLTEGCNQACQHCWITPKYTKGESTGGHVQVEELLEICSKARDLGLEGVKLTGGEPLLYPDFSRLVYGLKELGLEIWMESNLTLLTPENAVAILNTMTFISTSLDAASEQAHDSFRGVPGSFNATLKAIRLLSPHIDVQAIMSIHAGNLDEVEDVIRLASEHGASSVKFNLVHTQGRADKMLEKGRVLDVEALIELGKTVEGEWQEKHGIRLSYTWPPAFWPLSSMGHRPMGMCGIHSVMGLLGSGQYALCGVGKNFEELVYGSIKDDLQDIWLNSSKLKALRADVPSKLEGVCGRCIFKSDCKASCVANNYHDRRRLNAAHWFCQEAFDKGLFPETRLV